MFVRFWNQVAINPDGCWLWTGNTTNSGYGRCGRGLAHRVAYEYATGKPIEDDFVIDHLCRTPLCVRPDHLEPVRQKVNIERGDRWNGQSCPQGHEYTPENTYMSPSGGRRCRKCHAARERARQAARR